MFCHADVGSRSADLITVSPTYLNCLAIIPQNTIMLSSRYTIFAIAFAVAVQATPLSDCGPASPTPKIRSIKQQQDGNGKSGIAKPNIVMEVLQPTSKHGTYHSSDEGVFKGTLWVSQEVIINWLLVKIITGRSTNKTSRQTPQIPQ